MPSGQLPTSTSELISLLSDRCLVTFSPLTWDEPLIHSLLTERFELQNYGKVKT